MVFILCYILHDALTDGPLFFPHVPSERSFVCLSPSPEFRAQPLTSTAARESQIQSRGNWKVVVTEMERQPLLLSILMITCMRTKHKEQ